mgnify:CR=1 FL=1
MPKQKEIFEIKEDELEHDAPISESVVEPVVEEIPEIQQPLEPPVKKIDGRSKRKGTKVSPEQKKILIDNLARGRAKALENRRKKAELKKIEKQDKISENEDKILDALLKKKNKSKDNETLLKEISELTEKLNQQDINHKQALKKRKISEPVDIPKPKKSEEKQEEKPVEIQGGLPPGFAGHKPQARAPKPPVNMSFSERDIAKLMKNIR